MIVPSAMCAVFEHRRVNSGAPLKTSAAVRPRKHRLMLLLKKETTLSPSQLHGTVEPSPDTHSPARARLPSLFGSGPSSRSRFPPLRRFGSIDRRMHTTPRRGKRDTKKSARSQTTAKKSTVPAPTYLRTVKRKRRPTNLGKQHFFILFEG